MVGQELHYVGKEWVRQLIQGYNRSGVTEWAVLWLEHARRKDRRHAVLGGRSRMKKLNRKES
jgi:hypothetical protein